MIINTGLDRRICYYLFKTISQFFEENKSNYLAALETKNDLLILEADNKFKEKWEEYNHASVRETDKTFKKFIKDTEYEKHQSGEVSFYDYLHTVQFKFASIMDNIDKF